MQNFEENFLKIGKVLLLDSSGEHLSVALFENGRLLGKGEKLGGALENIFALISDICECAKVKIAEINSFGFCVGVGSILSIRTASNAFSIFRELAKNAKCFAWRNLDAYAQILAKEHCEFALVCPSRKGFANALVYRASEQKCAEIDCSEIKNLSKKIFQILQRKVSDKNFDGLESVYFDCEKIFEILNERQELIAQADSCEIFDAQVLSKREYVKWNSATHS